MDKFYDFLDKHPGWVLVIGFSLAALAAFIGAKW